MLFLIEITMDIAAVYRTLTKEFQLISMTCLNVFTMCELCVQVLFCGTEIGRTSFVRQLEPDWHIDTNPEIVSQLAVHLL